MTKKLKARLDRICRRITAFDGFEDLLNAKGSYRPSIYPPKHCRLSFRLMYWQLAKAYDEAMEARGDDRRAYTAGII